MRPFKEEFTFGERFEESRDILSKYPDRVPVSTNFCSISWNPKPGSSIFKDEVIAERFSRSDLPEMEKRKYLVPRDMSVGQFIHILRCRLHLASGRALFVFINDTLPQTASLMYSIYESYKDEDGFLYMCYSSEKTFG
ncbi:autophagy-related protein 8i-like isoform X1 [Asparagus officinalis]|uniref:autophagy-related protein 8i-like isoform X1 n=1 Tax=Asparagus officinalis TaxID=4686 RepID=UPI00098E167C|nr:autophagy-related protein 8i-like isoform X1 [Asparagus officinalis]